ncbi:MAG: C40 family peptidase [Bacilli bacterium]|nr:C40 family peptidase [Bacilli bacterium]
MKYIDILSCNSNLGSCCNDGIIVNIIDVVRKIFFLFQIIVPIILLITLSYQLIKLIINPDEKNGMRKFFNRFKAAIIIFFIPMFINIVMNLLPDNESFNLSACWKEAQYLNEIQQSQTTKYIDKYDGKRTLIIKKEETKNNSGTITPGNGSATGQSIVNYAASFVGQRYVYGGSWNGEVPYSGTDCSGFVQGVYKHFGIRLSRTTSSMWAARSTYTLVSPNDIRAGDLIMYSGHVGILTGNGNELIHAANSRRGVVRDRNYKTAGGSSNTIYGIMRINGVN